MLGIDPGGRHAGVVLRVGNQLLAHQVIEVAPPRTDITAKHTKATLAAIEAVLNGCPAKDNPDWQPLLVAVESVVQPTPHMGVIAVLHLLGTATLYGACLAHPWPGRVIEVRPGGHGKGLLGSYPDDLVTAAERRKGLQRQAGDSALIRHCRSAWDVAGEGRKFAVFAA